MSNLNELKRFEQDVNASKELKGKLDEICKRIAAEGVAQSDGDVMAAAAKELGYDVSVAALEQAKAEAEKLDPAALEAVAGGKEHPYGCTKDYACTGIIHAVTSDEYDHDGFCVTAWHCYMATLHTESKEQDISCWKDWSCWFVNK